MHVSIYSLIQSINYISVKITKILIPQMANLTLWFMFQVIVAKHIANQYRPHVRMSGVVMLPPYRVQRSKISERLKGAYEEILVTTVTKGQGKAY